MSVKSSRRLMNTSKQWKKNGLPDSNSYRFRQKRLRDCGREEKLKLYVFWTWREGKKQRVEEVRETQKKDVENLNMKERFVRKELCRLRLHALTWHHYFVAWESMWKVASNPCQIRCMQFISEPC